MAKPKVAKKYILRASFVDKNGVKHYARDHGKRCFKIYLTSKR